MPDDDPIYNIWPLDSDMDADENIPVQAMIKISGPDGFDTGPLTSDDQRDYRFEPSRGTISGGELRVRNFTFTDPDSSGGGRVVLCKGAKSKPSKSSDPPP